MKKNLSELEKEKWYLITLTDGGQYFGVYVDTHLDSAQEDWLIQVEAFEKGKHTKATDILIPSKRIRGQAEELVMEKEIGGSVYYLKPIFGDLIYACSTKRNNDIIGSITELDKFHDIQSAVKWLNQQS